MKRGFIMGLITGLILASALGVAYARVQNALTDANGVTSMLGDYNDEATRVKVDANGYLLITAM